MRLLKKQVLIMIIAPHFPKISLFKEFIWMKLFMAEVRQSRLLINLMRLLLIQTLMEILFRYIKLNLRWHLPKKSYQILIAKTAKEFTLTIISTVIPKMRTDSKWSLLKFRKIKCSKSFRKSP